jgi:hypothetical protein
MSKAKFVFLNAEYGSIVVSINKEPVACAFTAKELAEVFTANNVTEADDIYFSSSVDFASEEGFETDDDAHAIINEALELVDIV